VAAKIKTLRRRSLVPIVTLHRTPGLIHAIIRRVIFVDDDCWRRWCAWLNDNADAGTGVRLICAGAGVLNGS